MKKLFVFIGILLVMSCNSTAKKEKEILQKENELLQRELELTKKEQNIEIVVNKSAYTFDNFHISENRVGIFSKGMTISDVYNVIPKEQIKKKVGYGEHVYDTYDDYEIYDSDGKKILTLTPKQNGNTNSKINSISILDNRFKTTEGIGLTSTFGSLKQFYSIDNISPDLEDIFLDVESINAYFIINKTELQEGWWKHGQGIDKSKIPNTAKFDGMGVSWE